MTYPAKVIAWFEGRIRTAKEEVDQIARQWQLSIADLTSVKPKGKGGRGSSEENSLRPKRQIAALLGAASILTGLFSFGVGVSNQKELHNLYEETQRLDENQQKLLHHLRTFEQRTEASIKSILTGVRTEYLKTKANLVFDTKVRDLRQTCDKMLVGLYQALMGQLDPHLVSAHELRTALDGLEKAKAVGLKLAPLENDIEILFSLPITTLLKDGALHMWLTVPLISIDSPIFDIFSITHEQHQPFTLKS